MDWRQTELDGVLRTRMAGRDDNRGTFRELWRLSSTQAVGISPFVQANLSRSQAGVLRGLHFHLRQKDLWIILEGRAHLALVDVRPQLAGGSPGGGRRFAEVLGPADAVLIPEGVAHGFWALEPVSLLYLVTNEYDGTDELGFAWDDPDAGASWPAQNPNLSDRDAGAPSLAKAMAAIQGRGQISAR